MSVNYNTLKSMKGMAIGTIIPWSGPISGKFGIPKGWLACTANRSLNISEYPELYDIIGNRYGGSVGDGTFNLPSLPGKSLVDYHPSHSTELGYTGNFASFLGSNDDVANQFTTSQSSNIDVRLTLASISGNLVGNITGMNINASRYSTAFGFVPRKLGDGHLGSHTHGGTYPSIRVTDARIEACQNNPSANCFSIFGIPDCSDDCDTVELYRSGNASSATDDFCIPKYEGGEHLGRGSIPYGTNGYKMRRRAFPRNYIGENDDCLLANQTSADPGVGTGNDGPWEGIYGTTLNQDYVNFQTASLTGHDHRTQSLQIDSGTIATKDTVRINTISTGTISPVNSENQQVMTITANVNTPSMQMMFIIKAY
jgi:microcystin-dependent protein